MNVFSGNILLEERSFSALNWGCYMKAENALDGRLLPFIFLYKDEEQVHIITYQEAEDNYIEGLRFLKKSEIIFDQFIIGYEGEMSLDESGYRNKVVIIKAFDKRMDKGVFMGQIFKIEKEEFIKVENPKILDLIPMEFERSAGEFSTSSEPKVSSNIISIRNEKDTIDLRVLVRGQSESEIYHHLKQGLQSVLLDFEEENLSGIFSIAIQENEKINKHFLEYLMKDSINSILNSQYVDDKFTEKGTCLSYTIEYGDQEIYSKTTIEAIRKDTESIIEKPIIKTHNKTNISVVKVSKKWWKFWK